jgi:uncharacterized protein YciI
LDICRKSITFQASGVMVKTVGVEFFCYHRDRPGSVRLRDEMAETHWSYMDQYQAQMIARGPTLADDGTPTGSMHIVGLPDPAAARAFAFDEPNYAALLGTAVLVRAPGADAARAVLTPGRYAAVEVHNWQFGGRPR